MSYERKCRLYCVGAAKTGTHSIASLFDQTVRSAHEPGSREVLGIILALSEGRMQAANWPAYIRKRDKKLRLDVDSSQLNLFLLDYLLAEFPDSLFLLTIRDCYSWLNSFINHSLRWKANAHWTKFREHRFGASVFSHPPEERALKDRGLYTLDGYLSYWARHNNKVLSSIPEDRLLVVKTNEITKRAYEIAGFSGLPRDCVRIERSHSFKNPVSFDVLSEVPETYLESKVNKHCGPLMERWFPEITI